MDDEAKAASIVEVPTRVLKAAALFVAGKDERRAALKAAKVAWDDEGTWEVQATDSFTAIDVRSGHRLVDPEHSVLFYEFKSLRRHDDTVLFDDELPDRMAYAVRSDSPWRRPIAFCGSSRSFPDVGRLFDEDRPARDMAGAVQARYLERAAKAARILEAPRTFLRGSMALRLRSGGMHDGRHAKVFVEMPRLRGIHAEVIMMPCLVGEDAEAPPDEGANTVPTKGAACEGSDDDKSEEGAQIAGPSAADSKKN